MLERLHAESQAKVKKALKKNLLSVFLSALIYNPSATIKLMEMMGATKQILSDILELKK